VKTVENQRRFGGSYRFHLQDRALLAAGFHPGTLLGMFFDLEDGSDMFLHNDD
jgi:hypothetical protein